METIVAGSIEQISLKWNDRRNSVTDLITLAPVFDVLDPSDTAKQSAVPCVVTGMTVHCLIDTTQGGIWPSDIYRLYVKFTASPESPIHGPFPFKVENR